MAQNNPPSLTGSRRIPATSSGENFTGQRPEPYVSFKTSCSARKSPSGLPPADPTPALHQTPPTNRSCSCAQVAFYALTTPAPVIATPTPSQKRPTGASCPVPHQKVPLSTKGVLYHVQNQPVTYPIKPAQIGVQDTSSVERSTSK